MEGLEMGQMGLVVVDIILRLSTCSIKVKVKGFSVL
jgi:hypothetical protein